MVVSPQPRRPTPSLNVEHVPSLEVVTPWALPEESLSPMGSPWATQGLSPTSDNCDETPLLHVSSPISEPGMIHHKRYYAQIHPSHQFRCRLSQCLQYHCHDRRHRGLKCDVHQH